MRIKEPADVNSELVIGRVEFFESATNSNIIVMTNVPNVDSRSALNAAARKEALRLLKAAVTELEKDSALAD